MKFQTHNQDATIGWVLHAAGCALILLVVGASYVFGFDKIADQHEAQTARSEQLNDLLQTASEVHQQHQFHHEELDQITQLSAFIRNRLPSSPRKQRFENDVKEVATKVNFTLEKTSWSSPTINTTHSSIAVTISGNGSYASICKFLYEISQLTRITKVSRLAIESAKDSQHYPVELTFVLVYGVDTHDTEEEGETL